MLNTLGFVLAVVLLMIVLVWITRAASRAMDILAWRVRQREVQRELDTFRQYQERTERQRLEAVVHDRPWWN